MEMFKSLLSIQLQISLAELIRYSQCELRLKDISGYGKKVP